MKKQVPLFVHLNDEAKSILHNLTHQAYPGRIASGEAANFQPDSSTLLLLFAELVKMSAPDLCPEEWQLIANSLSPICDTPRLLPDLISFKADTILSLENIRVDDARRTDNIRISNKIAGFSGIHICAINYHLQLYLVAQYQGKHYQFPEIKPKN